jgi:hypothetical protein
MKNIVDQTGYSFRHVALLHDPFGEQICDRLVGHHEPVNEARDANQSILKKSHRSNMEYQEYRGLEVLGSGYPIQNIFRSTDEIDNSCCKKK